MSTCLYAECNRMFERDKMGTFYRQEVEGVDSYKAGSNGAVSVTSSY